MSIGAATVNSHQITGLLEEKHAKDVFFSEVKNGRSWGPLGHVRMDAWAMARSWAKPWMAGYEIKVTRSDFLRDDKWQSYLPLCNRFSFVAPKGLIQLEELGPDAGLIEVLGSRRLVTRRRAPHRNIEIPTDLLRYLLICRERPHHKNNLKYWQNWLTRKQESREVGYHVARSLRKALEKAQAEAKQARALVESYHEVRRVLADLGYDPDHVVWRWSLRDRIDRLAACVPPGLVDSLTKLEADLQTFRRNLQAETAS